MNFVRSGLLHVAAEKTRSSWGDRGSVLDMCDLSHRVIRHSYAVVIVEGHGHPATQQLPATEQLIEGRAELPAHGTVQNEVYGGIDQGQDVHGFTCKNRKRKIIYFVMKYNVIYRSRDWTHCWVFKFYIGMIWKFEVGNSIESRIFHRTKKILQKNRKFTT